MYEDKDVSNRHDMVEKSMVEVWRAARRAAEEARDGDGVGETQRRAEDAEGEKWKREMRERQNKQCNENTIHLYHLSGNTSSSKRSNAPTVTFGTSSRAWTPSSAVVFVLPASVYWTVERVVTAVKNWGQCVSRQPFSATGALEATWEPPAQVILRR